MRVILLIFILCCSSFLHGQEVLSDLVSNPILKSKKFIPNTNKSVLALGFFDDFSYNSPVADPNFWQQSSIFINRTYPLNPPTIGVATFDGLDENGLARDFSQLNLSEPSDTLLSQPINLSAVTSAYLMFYFQGKGIGDTPETQDSIILEFLNDTLAWEQIWFSTGQAMQEFDKVIKIIDEQKFLHSAFQFRFRNYATLSGNFDHWHIDYVKLDKFDNPNDTAKLNDVSFVYGAHSFLKRYEQMPWTHFRDSVDFPEEMNDINAIVVRNNGPKQWVACKYSVYQNNDTIAIAHYPSIGNNVSYEVWDYDSLGYFNDFSDSSVENSMFIPSSTSVMDSVSFRIEYVLDPTLNEPKRNNTLYYQQEFNSSFAYDDGVAESAYGINVSGAKLAYQFKLNQDDILRGIQMYFPQMLDSVNHIPFELTIWDDNGGVPGDTLYTQTVFPVHTTNGRFKTYKIEKPFEISAGPFYVGWKQTTNDPLNIGLDKNKIANQYMFYDVGSGWSNSLYPGAWMIRPIVNEDEVILSSVNKTRHKVLIFPNPAKEELTIISSTSNNLISIYNLQGILVKQLYVSDAESKINITDLAIGMYVIEIKNKGNRSFQKFIIK